MIDVQWFVLGMAAGAVLTGLVFVLVIFWPMDA